MNKTRDYRGLRFHTQEMRDGRIHFYVERISDGHILHSWPYRVDSAEVIDDLMYAWIDEKLGTHAPETVHCAACATRLEPVGRQDTAYQFDNALWITFSGGYGMFVDPLGKDEPRDVICHSCAHRLCAENPWIDALLRPAVSHSHPTAQREALSAAGHLGWDLLPTNLDDEAELRTHLRDDHRSDDIPDDGRLMWSQHHTLHLEPGNDHQH